jgi:hypothetical protein
MPTDPTTAADISFWLNAGLTAALTFGILVLMSKV